MPRPSDSSIGSSGIRLWVIGLLAVAILTLATVIWTRTRQAHPVSDGSTEMPAGQSASPRRGDIPNVQLITPTSSSEPALISAAAETKPTLSSSNEAALEARISELEAQLAALQTQLTNSTTNDSSVPMTGTWSCVNHDWCGALTRQITISGAGSSRSISVLETDNCQTMNWGEVPFIDVGTPNPGQFASSYPTGFAIFRSAAGQGGFQDTHLLFLQVTFEPQGILTVWGRAIVCVNCVPSWFTNFMAPAN
jgi:hypothetical protein